VRKLKRGERAKPLDCEEFVHGERYRNLQVRRIAGSPDVQKAKEEIAKHYFFAGLTERFEESIEALARLCPYALDTRYRTLRVARDNTVKQRLLADPAMRAALLEANALDRGLYEYVREVVYPAALEKAGLPDEGRKDGAQLTHLHPHRYRICRLYNNAVYKQLLKVRRLRVRPR
jgi:hypothetical protein